MRLKTVWLNRIGLGLALALALVILPVAAFGQSQNAEISGKVLDPEGLPLPGTTITLTEQATGYTRVAISAASGAYVVPNLRPGTYDLKVEVQGFKTVSRTGLILSSGAELKFDWKLELATIEEVVTVTAETPLVEVTSNKLGGTLSRKEIDEVPSNFRNFTALTQLVPGMTPNPAQSTFEGGQVNANGNSAWSNVYMIDGGYNNDDRLGGSQGTQVRMVLDVVEEYQVLANQYSAEFGGGTGALINMVTRGGTNELSGRAYAYFRNDSLYSRSAFLDPGEPKPDERSLQAGFGIGGPIVRDRAHFYFNYERDEEEVGGIKRFPPQAAPLARDFIGYFTVDANNYFARADVQINRNNLLSWRWVLEQAPTLGEEFNVNEETIDALAPEADWDQVHNFSLTSTIGDRASNVFRFGRIGEQLGTGNKTFFAEDKVEYLGLQGRDPFAIGSRNEHPSYITGSGGDGANTRIRTYLFDDTFSYFVPGWGGDHNFKFGAGFSLNRVTPRAFASSGLFVFEGDRPYNPADAATYPAEFEISVGPEGQEFEIFSRDWRAYFFVQDKWRINDRLTLNLGLRYDAQNIVPDSRDDLAPRVGFAYDPMGDGKTVIRGGFGRFSEYTRSALDVFLQQRGVVSGFPTITVSDPDSAVLQPDVTTDSAGNLGVAVLSEEGQDELRRLRDAILAGSTFSRNPWVDSERQMPYQWAWSLGVTRELVPNLAVSIDYVANVSRDQLGIIDINEAVNGVRPGVNVFDPDGQLVTGAARNVNFARVLQYQTGPQFDGDYKSLQVGVIKRFSNRFSMRHAYTLQRSNYVGLSYPENRRVWLDNEPRADYGRFEFDRRHVLSLSGTVNLWRGLNVAGIVSASSGRPVNETTGVDGNGDLDRNDRPIQGVDDAVRPIASEVDSQGRAVPNGLDGPSYVELNLSARYNFDLTRGYGLGLFWDAYNLTNRTNLSLPTGNRRSSNFLVSTSAGFPRQMQFGIRFTF